MNNHFYASLFSIRTGKVGIRKYYTGWDTYLSLANGNIRYLLELVHAALLEHLNVLEESNTTNFIPITYDVQTNAAIQIGRKNLTELEGLSVGADDYITKPFNMKVLKLRINKIIEMNVKRQEIFNQDIKIEPSRITITPLDQQLVEKAIQIVEDNISETEFSVEELASSLNISRSYFYKKMIKITGKKPIEFIRTIRMKRAQQLLTESQMQVSEIAYTLGYNSPKIFSKHFKEEFNISPSEFIRQQAE